MAALSMNDHYHHHTPVLLHEAVANLITSPDGVYVDATFGRGNHTRAILNALSPQGTLIAFDKDPEAVAYAKAHFSQDRRFTIFHQSFEQLANTLQQLQVFGQVQG